ncbi:hypothetical protein M569_05699, partial [Genlisea aurea]
KSVTPGALSLILANPCPDSSSEPAEIIVQVLDLKPTGNKYVFLASDGRMKVRALLQSSLSADVSSGEIQNLGLIRVLDYTLNDIPTKNEKFLIVTKCESVSPALAEEYSEVKTAPEQKPESEDDAKHTTVAVVLKPKQEVVSKSAAQILHEQNMNLAPSSRTAMTRRIHPLVSLSPYQGNWTIKVRVTGKGNMRTYKNARGEGCVFNVELTDEDGTQIQATMFNNAAKKFFDRFQLGKVFYVSKGVLKIANKQFKTVQNDYEMTLNENSEVEEASNEETFIPETKFNFVPIDELGPYVNGRELIDVIGIVQSVSPTVSIRRKSDNEMIPKRDITIADTTKRSVVVSLWGDLATNVGQDLLDIADKSPVVAIKSLKVGDFQGVSLSALSKSVVLINPDTIEAHKLRHWYDCEGKDASMDAVGSGMTGRVGKGGVQSMYSDRVSLAYITDDPSLGHDKVLFY